MPKRKPKDPTRKDAVFASDMLEARRDAQQLQRSAKRWKLDMEKALKLLEAPRREERRRNPKNRM